MSIWNVPVCAPRSATPTGNAGLPLNAGHYAATPETDAQRLDRIRGGGFVSAAALGVTDGEEEVREACCRCELELERDGSCLTCMSADAKADALSLRGEVLTALADTLENGGSFAEALELALREARTTPATRVANSLPDSGIHVTRAGETELRFNVGGVVFTVTVGS